MNPFSRSTGAGWRTDGVGFVVCVILTGLGYWAGVRPTLARRLDESAVAKELEGKREENKSMSVQWREKDRLAEKQDAELVRVAVDLSAASQVNQHLESITALAEKHVAVEQVSPGPPENAKRFVRIPIKISGKGTYPEIVEFLASLHQSMPDTAVSAVSMAGQARDTASGSVRASFSVELVWHARAEGAAPDGGNGPVPGNPRTSG